MSRLPRVRLWLIATAVSCGGASLTAQSVGTERNAHDPVRSRTSSPAVAELLRMAAPKFSAHGGKDAAAPSTATPITRVEPRNTIVRLPPYEVREPKVRVPQREREVLTEKGKLELALKRHPGLKLGNFGPLRNDVWARAMLEEDYAVERASEFSALLGATGRRRPVMIIHAPPPVIPPRSGPWGGLYVPWERR